MAPAVEGRLQPLDPADAPGPWSTQQGLLRPMRSRANSGVRGSFERDAEQGITADEQEASEAVTQAATV